MTELSSPGTPFRVLFVCTGNTCRSPMAEAIARTRAAERGWGTVEFRSAGVSAWPGSPASEAVIQAANRRGVEGLDGHRSTPVTEALLDWADLVLAMTPSHLALLLAALEEEPRGPDGPGPDADSPQKTAPDAPPTGGPGSGFRGGEGDDAEEGGEGNAVKLGLLTTFASSGEGRSDALEAGVPDPFGGSAAEYEATWEVLEGLVGRMLDRLAPIVRP